MNLSKIIGIHAVQSALDYSADKIHQAWIDTHRQDRKLTQISDALNNLGITCQKADRKQLDRLANSGNHQGIVIEVDLPKPLGESALKAAVEALQTPAFFLVLDHVQDPHNLGACLRTCEAAGVNGIIITKDQATGITPTVCKVASGAAETVPVYQVTNLARTLRWLKQQNIWVYGTAGEAKQTVYETDLNSAIALVIGAEGKGMRRLTREQCDGLIKLPMMGSVESLNLSVAAGVLIYEVLRQKSQQ